LLLEDLHSPGQNIVQIGCGAEVIRCQRNPSRIAEGVRSTFGLTPLCAPVGNKENSAGRFAHSSWTTFNYGADGWINCACE
jgi:hypothetical protein